MDIGKLVNVETCADCLIIQGRVLSESSRAALCWLDPNTRMADWRRKKLPKKCPLHKGAFVIQKQENE